ncbi:MAG: aminotransferase class I/II-fold pyridoxal phosphate-dependent enzyme [Clostridia bacterium]|nr:aminotransferase class I/II-fold pyridoxal phosphate-dependent enzyme [Clostridia bacterium]
MADELWKKLKKHCGGDSLPMHMPGHKRRGGYDHLDALSASLDITEIDGFDDLNDPRSILRESEEAASALWGCRETVYSVNGSTSCVLAAVRAVCPPGSRIVMARNCHRSVYHAVEICSLDPVYVMPERVPGTPLPGSVSPEAVERALGGTPDASAVVMTSPTYEGVISDVGAIAEIARRAGVPLIVDEAHGAHLGLFGAFPGGAIAAGADVVIHSLHKTLASLTQTAALHNCGSSTDVDEIRRQMSVFQTSSPSYLLTASLDGCVRRLAETGGRDLIEWRDALRVFREKISGLGNLREPVKAGEGVFMTDPSKIFITAAHVGLSGTELDRRLREEFGIECEMSTAFGALAMTGQGDTEQSLARFAEALLSLDRTIVPGRAAIPEPPYQTEAPERIYLPADAVRMKKETVPLRDAQGRVAAGYVYSYPPGVPILVPGEVVGRDVVEALASLSRAGIRLRGVENDSVEVIAE